MDFKTLGMTVLGTALGVAFGVILAAKLQKNITALA